MCVMIVLSSRQAYAEECIELIKVEYADNQPCIELLQKPPLGVFKLLDSQCKTPKVRWIPPPHHHPPPPQPTRAPGP